MQIEYFLIEINQEMFRLSEELGKVFLKNCQQNNNNDDHYDELLIAKAIEFKKRKVLIVKQIERFLN